MTDPRRAQTEAFLENNVHGQILLERRLRAMDHQACYEAADPSRYLKNELAKLQQPQAETTE